MAAMPWQDPVDRSIAAVAAPTGFGVFFDAGNPYSDWLLRPTAVPSFVVENTRMRPRSHALRRGRWSEAGRVYLVTFTTFDRRHYFHDWLAGCTVARVLSGGRAWADARPLCWVLMPDHWHGLIELGTVDNLSRSVGRAKAAATREWNRAGRATDRLWATGFHDHALRSEESLLDATRYVVANPLRAGLAQRIGDYPFWDAVWLEN